VDWICACPLSMFLRSLLLFLPVVFFAVAIVQ
jgi:hypothetical protein